MRTQYRERAKTPLNSLIGMSSDLAIYAGLQKRLQKSQTTVRVEILVGGMAFGATSGTWGNVLTCATKAGTVKENVRQVEMNVAKALQSILKGTKEAAWTELQTHLSHDFKVFYMVLGTSAGAPEGPSKLA